MGSKALPQTVYLPDAKGKEINNVAFEAPLTIEVIDRDAAKTSRSHVVAQLETSSGAKIDVRLRDRSRPGQQPPASFPSKPRSLWKKAASSGK